MVEPIPPADIPRWCCRFR